MAPRDRQPSARDLIADGNKALERVADASERVADALDRVEERLDDVDKRLARIEGLHDAEALRAITVDALRTHADAEVRAVRASREPTGPILIESSSVPRQPTGPLALGPAQPPAPAAAPEVTPHVSPPLQAEDVGKAIGKAAEIGWRYREPIVSALRRVVWPALTAAGVALLAYLFRLCGPLLPPSMRDRDHGDLTAPLRQYVEASEDGDGKRPKKPAPLPDEKKKRDPPPTPDPKHDRRVDPQEGRRTADEEPAPYSDTACDGGPREPERCKPEGE